MKRSNASIIFTILFLVPCDSADAFPIGVSVRGGIGMGYYSMSELNNHIRTIGYSVSIPLSELENGINVNVHGRLWLFDRIAVSAGYERFWAETTYDLGSYPIEYKGPADVYTIGGVLSIFSFPDLIDINFGVNGCIARSVFGTNIFSGRLLTEFKGNDNGYEAFAEIATNFIRPVELAFQLGYRGIKVESYENKYGDVMYFPDPYVRVQLDYSGAFFYITAGIRI